VEKRSDRSAFASPGQSGMSVAALVTLASAVALALVVLALSATPAQSTERHDTISQ
jgi:hypothetical protein